MATSFAGSKSLRLAIGLVLAAPLGAVAQEVKLEEIVVTAQKRAEAIQDIPMSVTALSTSDIELSNATTIEDLQFKVPGLSLVSFNAGQQQYQLRGISSNQGLPTVGLYVDEMPINTDLANANPSIDLRDLDRVEVLRGPQGTLYGEGSMGGTIKYVTTSPRLDRYEGSVGAEYAFVTDGSPNWEVSGVANLPVVEDVFGIRLVASYTTVGGWIDNVPLDSKDDNSGSTLNFRGKALWQVTDSTTASLLFLHSELDADGANYSVDDRTSFARVPTPIEDKSDMFNLVLTHDADSITLLSSTGYIDRGADFGVDLTPAFLPFLEAPPPFGFGVPAGTITGIGGVSSTDFKILTQELRLSSSGEDRLRWTAGLYYRDYEATTNIVTYENPVPIADVLGIPGFQLLTTDTTDTSTAWAVFGEATYAFSPEWELTLGARYYEDDRSRDSTSSTFGSASVDQDSNTFDTFNPKIALLYRIGERSSVYANVAKGFRSGGFNNQSAGLGVPVPPTYDPESLWTYEIGGVANLGAGQLLLQWDVYYNDWKDVQTFVMLQGLPITILGNGGKASGFGADLQATYLPTDALEITGTIGWSDMEYKSTTEDHLPGDPMDFVAPLTGALTATYNFSLGDNLRSFLRGELQYTDKFQVTIRNFLPEPVYSEARTLVRLAYGLGKGAWDAQLFVNNLLDEDKIAMPAYGSLAEPIRTQPRTIGVNFTYRY